MNTTRKTDQERILEFARKHHTRDVRRICSALSKQVAGAVSSSVIRDVLAADNAAPLHETAKPKCRKMTREQFAKQYDGKVRTREAILEGIKRIGPEELVPEHVFRSEYCRGALTSHWRAVASEDNFFGYQVKADGKIHWAQPDTIKWALESVQGAKEPY